MGAVILSKFGKPQLHLVQNMARICSQNLTFEASSFISQMKDTRDFKKYREKCLLFRKRHRVACSFLVSVLLKHVAV